MIFFVVLLVIFWLMQSVTSSLIEAVWFLLDQGIDSSWYQKLNKTQFFNILLFLYYTANKGNASQNKGVNWMYARYMKCALEKSEKSWSEKSPWLRQVAEGVSSWVSTCHDFIICRDVDCARFHAYYSTMQTYSHKSRWVYAQAAYHQMSPNHGETILCV